MIVGWKIADGIAIELRDLRNRYYYPGAQILPRESKQRASSVPVPGFDWAFAPAGDRRTDLSIEQTFEKGLHSKNDGEFLMAIASVVYWGWNSPMPSATYLAPAAKDDARARKRIDFLIKGKAKKIGLANPRSVPVLHAVREDVVAGLFGDALGTLTDIAELGSTPFASKVIAYFAPAKAGIYDNQIQNILGADASSTPGQTVAHWAQQAARVNGFLGGVGFVRSKVVQTRYQNWCDFIRHSAERLNERIESGQAHLRWTDGRFGPQNWRAIDVERAIFQARSRKTATV